MESDVLERLRKWASYRVGDMPQPVNNWGERLTADLNDAIAEIEHLRGGGATIRRQMPGPVGSS